VGVARAGEQFSPLNKTTGLTLFVRNSGSKEASRVPNRDGPVYKGVVFHLSRVVAMDMPESLTISQSLREFGDEAC
jgi:hypothetical protein